MSTPGSNACARLFVCPLSTMAILFVVHMVLFNNSSAEAGNPSTFVLNAGARFPAGMQALVIRTECCGVFTAQIDEGTPKDQSLPFRFCRSSNIPGHPLAINRWQQHLSSGTFSWSFAHNPRNECQERERHQSINNPTKDKKRKRRRRTTSGAGLTRRNDRLLALTSSDPFIRQAEMDYQPANFKITRNTFYNLINYWSHSGSPSAASNVERLLSRMEDISERDPTTDIHAANGVFPDVRGYTMLVTIYAKRGGPTAGIKAEEVLRNMTTRANSIRGNFPETEDMRPNVHTYTAAMEAWANSGREDAAPHAESLLSSLRRLYEASPDGQERYRPTARTYNAVINAWAKTSAVRLGSAHMAEQRLDDMERLRSSDPRRYSHLRPNRINYNSVMHAWANSGEEDAAVHAEDILFRLETQYDNTGEGDTKPTVKSYNAVIDAWAKSEGIDAARHSEMILDKMWDLYETTGDEDVRPNVRTFNSVLNAWAKSGARDAGVNADRILERMEHLAEDDTTQGGWIDDNGSSKGKAPHPIIEPDVHSYSTVINAWGRSFSFGKAERARDVLLRMKGLYESRRRTSSGANSYQKNENLRPNTVVYNAVMNACAYCVGDGAERRRAVEIAHETFQELESSPEYGRPDQVTYGTFLKACVNQMPSTSGNFNASNGLNENGTMPREAVVEAVFKKCRKDGQVGDLVLREMRVGLSDTNEGRGLYLRLLGHDIDEDISTKILPHEWRRNVQERRTHSYNRARRKRE